MSDPRDPKPNDSDDAARRYPEPGPTRPADNDATSEGEVRKDPAAQPGKQPTPAPPTERRQ